MERHWLCPNCDAAAVTHSEKLPYHRCPKLPGLMAPLIQEGIRAKVEAVERQDYIGKETGVLLDANGRAIMSIVTTRDDGTDAMVFPATATGSSD